MLASILLQSNSILTFQWVPYCRQKHHFSKISKTLKNGRWKVRFSVLYSKYPTLQHVWVWKKLPLLFWIFKWHTSCWPAANWSSCVFTWRRATSRPAGTMREQYRRCHHRAISLLKLFDLALNLGALGVGTTHVVLGRNMRVLVVEVGFE